MTTNDTRHVFLGTKETFEKEQPSPEHIKKGTILPLFEIQEGGGGWLTD